MNQLQLDELYAVLREVKAGARSENEAIERLERSSSWVWTAMDPESKLLLVMDVGTRTWRWPSASCINWCRCWRRAVCYCF